MKRRTIIGSAAAAAAAAILTPALIYIVPGNSGTQSISQHRGVITHFLYVMYENHSFDNIAKDFCLQHPPSGTDTAGRSAGNECRVLGAPGQPTKATISTGAKVSMGYGATLVPEIEHDIPAQTTAIDNGKMDQYDKVNGCGGPNYDCIKGYSIAQIPNIAAAADKWAIDDNNFAPMPIPSWGAHLLEGDGGLPDGFYLTNPQNANQGWGCDSNGNIGWTDPPVLQNTGGIGANATAVSPCIPAPAGSPEVNSQSLFVHKDIIANTVNGSTGVTETSGPALHSSEDDRYYKISGPGIQPGTILGTKITSIPGSFFISKPATATQTGVTLTLDSPVPHIESFMDQLQNHNLSYKIYGVGTPSGTFAYKWMIGPTFADFFYTSQRNNMVDTFDPTKGLMHDASTGTLPNFAFVQPTDDMNSSGLCDGSGPHTSSSQHNSASMTAGDNYLGCIINATESQTDCSGGKSCWSNTVIFVSWDDCGCFYDHVPPPTSFPGSSNQKSQLFGSRVPMIILGGHVKQSYVDHGLANQASPLATVEHAFNLPPLTGVVARSYDYSNVFDWGTYHASRINVDNIPISGGELSYIQAHPPSQNDPT